MSVNENIITPDVKKFAEAIKKLSEEDKKIVELLLRLMESRDTIDKLIQALTNSPKSFKNIAELLK